VDTYKLITDRKNAGQSWGDIARELNTNRTGNAWRKWYNRQKISPQSPTSILNLKGNILIIGDTHFPFTHPEYLKFILNIRDRFKCKHAVHIGDLVDNHAQSFHESDPDGMSAGREYKKACEMIRKWGKEFDTVYGLLGNHDLIPHRKATSAGLSSNFLKTFEASWNLPASWKWYQELCINGVVYTHGTGGGAAIGRARSYMTSVVAGHNHTIGGATHQFGRRFNVWGLDVGCGIDETAYAMAYGRNFAKGIVLGCGVVLEENIPLFVPME
jgi:predicted phosphodiesterase